MEYKKPRSGKKVKTDRLNLDFISSLPQNIIEKILSLLPIKEALRTSILSKRWRYSWRGMPKLVFTKDMVQLKFYGSDRVNAYVHTFLLNYAMSHVLSSHKGHTILEFNCCVGKLHLIVQGIHNMLNAYLSRGNSVKELTFIENDFCELPVSFFSLQGLELINLEKCYFEPPSTFKGFRRLRSMTFVSVELSAQTLQRLLSKSPLLEHICLSGNQEITEFEAGGTKFTLVDLLQCVPLIWTLDISKYYMKYLCAGGMPHKLPTSLAHLKYLYLDVCMAEYNEISSALCIIRSSPLLEQMIIMMYDNETMPVRQTPANFLDPENYSDMKLDHLDTLEIEMFSDLPLGMKFLRLIMAKSPVLKKARIEFNEDVPVDEEVEMLRDLLQVPFARASPSAKLIFERP